MKKFTNLLTIIKNLKPKNTKAQLKKERIMKNFDELYGKYYNAYRNDTDELSEAEKKKIGSKQFEIFDKTDKNLTQLKKERIMKNVDELY